MALSTYIDRLKAAFAGPDRYDAHRAAAPILRAMAEDRAVLHDIFRQQLGREECLRRTRHHPVISFVVEENPAFTLIASCFMPLPGRETDVSHQTIHHHGSLLLSTAAAFGPGYESILFKGGWRIDEVSRLTRMDVDKCYTHRPPNVEFIDAEVPHIVFFPPALSVTYALWSGRRQYAIDALRKSKVLQQFKKPLIAAAKTLGMTRSLGINVIEDFDFYVEGGQVYALKDRIFGYEGGTNDNFLQNVCYVLQEIGFDDRPFLTQLKARLESAGEGSAARWVDRLLQGQPIADAFETCHLNIEKVNLRKADVLAAVASRPGV
jgi:hypothetical protein